MNKLKVLVCGSAFSTSGYAHHCRVVLDSLRLIEDKIDLYLLPYKWAMTTDTYKDKEKTKWYSSLVAKTNREMLGHFDISIQLGTPTEWKKFAKYNIGVTAVVETLTMNPEWVTLMNNVDKIITISEFSRDTILNTSLNDQKVNKEIDVIGFPYVKYESEECKLKLDTSFNFLAMGQVAPRKNYPNLIKWFCEEFKDNEDVGLVIKAYQGSNSTPDFYSTDLFLHDILEQYKDRKCKVYLLHGDMTDGQIQSLFVDNNIKCFINLSHGEGFAIPIFDAACNSIPVLSIDFGGQRDYLYQSVEDKKGKFKMKPLFQKVSHDINQVSNQHAMADIILPNMFWAYAKENDYKYKLREVYKDHGRFKKQAEFLAPLVREEFSFENISKKYIDSIFANFSLEQEEEIVEV